jgi:hypothetical protein
MVMNTNTFSPLLRLSAALLLVGQVLYFVVTLLHTGGPANDHPVIFAASAGSGSWTVVHIAQFACMATMNAQSVILGGSHQRFAASVSPAKRRGPRPSRHRVVTMLSGRNCRVDDCRDVTEVHDTRSPWAQVKRMTPHEVFASDPERSHVLEIARNTARAAHEIASPPMVVALRYLASLSDNSLLPPELRERAKEAALRVAEAALHLDYLPEVFGAADVNQQVVPNMRPRLHRNARAGRGLAAPDKPAQRRAEVVVLQSGPHVSL